MKLLHSPLSPFSAKVRMAARYAGISLELEAVNTAADPADLAAANPLGKIPTLIDDSGKAIFDSRVITQFLNRTSENKLFPRNPERRLEAEQLEALADGVCECLQVMVYEYRFRPEDKVHQPWLDRQWQKASRALDRLNEDLPALPPNIHVGHIALRAMAGYAEIRFPGKWDKGRPRLKRWVARFDERFPELAAEAPKA